MKITEIHSNQFKKEEFITQTIGKERAMLASKMTMIQRLSHPSFFLFSFLFFFPSLFLTSHCVVLSSSTKMAFSLSNHMNVYIQMKNRLTVVKKKKRAILLQWVTLQEQKLCGNPTTEIYISAFHSSF